MKIKLIMMCPKCENDKFHEIDLDLYECTKCGEEFEQYELDVERVIVQKKPIEEI